MLPTTIISLILLIFQLEIFKCQSNNTLTGIGGIDKEGAGADFKLPGLDKFNKVRLNEKNYERVRNMHANWYGAGIKAVMGKLGRDLYVKIKMDEQRKLANCLDGIDDKKDLVLAANCLINARKEYEKRRIWEKEDGGKWMDKKMENKISKKNEEIIYEMKNEEELPKRRLKRIKLRKLRNKRNSINENIGNGQRQKRMIDEKMEINEWSKRLRQFRWKSKMENSRKMEAEKMPKMKKSKWAIMDREGMRPKFEIRQADDLEKLPSQEDRSAIIRVSNLISMFGGSTNSTEERVSGAKWTKMYESLVRLKRANERRKESPGARVYEMRMYDLVLDKKEPSLGPKQKMSPEGLIQMGISLLNKLRNGTDQRESNFKFMSPRFAPLMPDKQDAHKSIFSPTVFALYEPEMNESNPAAAGNGAPKSPLNIASIPEVLRATGLNKQDRDALMQSLMEVSGSIGHVREAMDLLKALNFFEIEPDLADANDRILNAYTKMEKTFDSEQEREIEREGWTFLRGRQFDQLCKDQNADFPEKMRAEIEGFGALDRERRELALWKRIERIARNIPDEIGDKLDARKHEKLMRLHLDKKARHRRKRQTNTPGLSVLRPVILEPYMFTPVYGLSVLGPLILSPNIFSPLILAPSVLSPYVLSPAAPIPYILSPYVFGPFILSPMALAPFILTPYVLSPNVLNPFALAPLILSPTVLSPDILSPQILGGGILSPTVGSPAVLTESALMASVLSPSVLSK